MLEQIILGIIQGIAEWLPISSEGLIVLAKTHLFSQGETLEVVLQKTLFLHFGTFLAAVVYLRRDVVSLIKACAQKYPANTETKKVLSFLIVATLISGLGGLFLIEQFLAVEEKLQITGEYITLVIGLLLLVTGFLQLRAKDGGLRKDRNLKIQDAVVLGIAQAFSALPGLSRSGITVSALLLRKFDKTASLRLSFLMSIPIVFGGTIFLGFKDFSTFSAELLVGMFFSFIFGLATIHFLLTIAKKINFGFFVLGFGVLTLLSVLL